MTEATVTIEPEGRVRVNKGSESDRGATAKGTAREMVKALSQIFTLQVGSGQGSRSMDSRASKAFLLMMAVAVSSIAILLSASTCRAACKKTEHLFVVERSKNGNMVHYDVCIGDDDYPSDTEPVVAYWILENGKREDLNKLEREVAYGITEHKKLGKDTVKIILASMKVRAITVEKVSDRYIATILIDGKESVLERVYVKSHELIVGLPRVQFVDLYGRTKGKGLPVSERIGKTPERN